MAPQHKHTCISPINMLGEREQACPGGSWQGGRDGRNAPVAHAPARDKESDLSRALRGSGRGGGGSRGGRGADR